MYYAFIAVIAIILFLLRKRIIGGVVGIITLFIIGIFTILLFDFFWLGTDKDGNERDIRNFEPTQEVIKGYDDTVKDPKAKSKKIGDTIKGKGDDINEGLKSKGSELDQKLGITKEDKNNNLWGTDEGDSESNQENENTETTSTKNKEKGISKKEESSEKEPQGTNKENRIIKHENIQQAQSEWGLSEGDFKFVKNASPFNTGKFSNDSITIKVTKEGVELIGGK